MLNKLLDRLTDEIIVKEQLMRKLQEKKLRIKMGFDPTKPDLHLGHMVGLRALQKFQEEGHTIIFIIGDYTAKIGDPSGRNTTRPVLTDEEIKKNTDTYFNQISQILDTSKTEVEYNSKWFSKMTINNLLELLSQFTLAQIIERDDFSKRLKDGSNVSLNEILYPVMQAYDSVQVRADVEVGGSDQKFNMLAGRSLQKKMAQTPQEIITVKILRGLDGKNKMSKSLGNYVAINDHPNDIYGKIMSIPDDLITEYFLLCTDVEKGAIEIIKKELKDNSKNPRDVKAELAKLITEMYCGAEKAENAEQEFNRVHRDGQEPENIFEKEIDEKEARLDDLLVLLGLTSSKSEARRLIEQGGIEIDNNKISDPMKNIEIFDNMIVKAGKRNFVKIKTLKNNKIL